MHRGQTYLTASHSQLRYFCYFLISRRDGENNCFLAGVPLLPPPSRVVSRPNSLPLPFRTPATQASHKLASPADILRGASRVPAGTRDEPLRTPAWEASHKLPQVDCLS